MLNGTAPETLAAAFHNSFTLLTAELEGRSFGGGVLELVPSEVARLLIPIPHGFETELVRLDQLIREQGADHESIVEETDLLLQKAGIGLDAALVDVLREARLMLLERRLERNRATIRAGARP
jgi:hypothetical protein